MPGSFRTFDDEIGRMVRHAFPDKGAKILDVGAGSGKYAGILSDYPNRYAVEIFEPNVSKYKLDRRYAGVWLGDARELDTEFFQEFALVILGDVLEHFTAEEAQAVLGRIREAGCSALIAVPYLYAQEEFGGNPNEEHLQPDLTPQVVRARYPELQRFLGDDRYGIYGNAQFMNRLRGSGVPLLADVSIPIDEAKLRGARIAICTPHPGSVAAVYLSSMVETGILLSNFKVPFRLFMRSGACIDRVRNLLVKDVLDSEIGFTHLLWIDSDQGWEPSYVLRMLHHDKPMVGIASIKKTAVPGFAVHLGDAERVLYDHGLLEVSGVGTGFLLVRREVFEQMMDAFPALQVKHVPEQNDESSPKHYYTLYQTVLDENGMYIGEDLTFCNRYREIGGKVYVDPHCDLVHVGSKEFRGSLASHMMACPEGDE